MKARVKATGEIIEVEKTILKGVECYIQTTGEKIGSIYMECDLDFGFDCNYAPTDYWTRLEHQYAGMAMQGLVTRGEVLGSSVQEIARDIAEISCEVAHALVEKLKEKEE